MNEYLGEFHQFIYIFGEFRASKADHEEAANAVQELAEHQAQQATYELTTTQRAKQTTDITALYSLA